MTSKPLLGKLHLQAACCNVTWPTHAARAAHPWLPRHRKVGGSLDGLSAGRQRAALHAQPCIAEGQAVLMMMHARLTCGGCTASRGLAEQCAASGSRRGSDSCYGAVLLCAWHASCFEART